MSIHIMKVMIADSYSDNGASILEKLGYKCETKVVKIVDVPKLVQVVAPKLAQVETKKSTLPVSLLVNVDNNSTSDVETQLDGIVAFLGLMVMGIVYAIVYYGVQ